MTLSSSSSWATNCPVTHCFASAGGQDCILASVCQADVLLSINSHKSTITYTNRQLHKSIYLHTHKTSHNVKLSCELPRVHHCISPSGCMRVKCVHFTPKNCFGHRHNVKITALQRSFYSRHNIYHKVSVSLRGGKIIFFPKCQ